MYFLPAHHLPPVIKEMITVHFGLTLGLLFLVGDSLPEPIQCEKNQSPVTAMRSDTVYLPCSFRPDRQLDELLVSWQKEDQNATLVVHAEKQGGEAQGHQDDSFKTRTALSLAWNETGNVTLQLRAVTTSDSGNYTCFIRAGQLPRNCASLQLIVNSGTFLICAHLSTWMTILFLPLMKIVL
ncbi:CD276 antigen-like [Stegostoma tigrinum]|uniref:CD276 antigen-like n=1 Tax=Stegostoma tigrinum TaxID=3053191 RepID=UPI00202B3DE2|nr:CD276 antigen-like [Stegostoma tigrinum]